jgi:CheY-like chemotaxis protein
MLPTLGHIYVRDLKPLERNAMASLLKLSRGRGVSFEQIEHPNGAFAAMADGSAHDAVAWVLTLPDRLQNKVIWLGICPDGWPAGAASVIARPISWPRLLQRLEALWAEYDPVHSNTSPAGAPRAPGTPIGADTLADVTLTSLQTSRHTAPPFLPTQPENVRSFASVVPSANRGDSASVVAPPMPPAQPRPRTIPQVPGSNVESVFSKLNILIVDDHAVARQSLQSTLGFFSIGAAEAASAQEAARLVRNDPFDLLFLDVNMPGIDGYALCRELKRGRLGAGDPIIVMVTSRDGLIDKLRGTLAGADHFLTKPASTLDIEPILKECLTRRSANERKGAARRS